MTARPALCAALIAAAALPATAQVHRWVDEQGRVHYGDRPMSATGTTLRIRAESATAPSPVRVAPGTPVTPVVARPPAAPLPAAAGREAVRPRAAAMPSTATPAGRPPS